MTTPIIPLSRSDPLHTPPPNSTNLVAVTDVSISRRNEELPRPEHVTFEVKKGDRLLVLGPSGCGKSTLALALTGLIPHIVDAQLTGAVAFQGIPTTHRELHDITEQVSIVFQDPLAQLFTECVFDEVCFALENRCLPVTEIVARATKSLNDMDLLWARDRPVTELSGGEQQRLAIACALASKSSMLVLDEPTANLDPQARCRLYEIISELPPADAPAIVLIEHNIDDALRLVNRIVVLDERGSVVSTGSPREVFGRSNTQLRRLGIRLPFATQTYERLTELGLLQPSQRPPITDDELADALLHIERRGYTLAAPRTTSRSEAPPALIARDLTVQRGTTTALQDVSLTIPRGEISAIIGTSGAGKTTLLHSFAGLVKPQHGTLLANNQRITAKGASRIGLVFQNPEHQFVEATVRDELTAAANPQIDRDALPQKVDDELNRIGLSDLADHHPTTLSGGQKRRLSVAMAVLGGHDIIAFDEPTFGQDAATTAVLFELFQELNERGCTVIIVSHDMQLVADIASYAVVLHKGRVLARGPAESTLTPDVLHQAGLRLPPLAECAAKLPTSSPFTQLMRAADLQRIEECSSGTSQVAISRATAPGAQAPGNSAKTQQKRQTASDKRHSRRLPWIARRNPLARLLASIPPIVWTFISDDIRVSISCAFVAGALILLGLRPRWQHALLGILLVPLATVVLTLLFSLWIDPERAASQSWTDAVELLPGPLGTITLSTFSIAFVTAARIAAIGMLSLLAGLQSSRTGLIDALMQNARVPYRIGFTLFSALGFVTRLRVVSRQIDAAHRVRADAQHIGWSGSIRRRFGSAVALLVDAVQHAQRMTIAIESRAFGAHPTRTWRRISRWSAADTGYIIALTAATLGGWLWLTLT